MKRIWSFGSVLLIFVMLASSVPAFCADQSTTTPRTNSGKKWRIGYLEGGDYYIYRQHFSGVIAGLMELGWIEKAELPPAKDDEDIASLWTWLSKEARSDYLEFVQDAFWSCKWDKETRRLTRIQVLSRLSEKRDIDLMFAVGTWAGQDLANNDHSVPTVVLAVSDAVTAKIITSGQNSGYAHVQAWFDPKRDERQIRLFHDCIGFKRLGIAYEDSATGRSYASVSAIEQIAKERGFEVVHCHFLLDTPDFAKSNEGLKECFRTMAPGIDAFYLTQNNISPENLSTSLAPLYAHRIPVLSKQGRDVGHGALMGISRAGYKYIGLFEASTIAKILNGAKPGDLPQLFEEPMKIEINLAAAKQIGYIPPEWVLKLADRIYTEIKP